MTKPALFLPQFFLPTSVNEFKMSSRTDQDSASWQPSLANQRIVSLIFIAEVPLGEKKKSSSLSYSLPAH